MDKSKWVWMVRDHEEVLIHPGNVRSYERFGWMRKENENIGLGIDAPIPWPSPDPEAPAAKPVKKSRKTRKE